MAIELTSVREKLERLKRRFEELEGMQPNYTDIEHRETIVNI